MSRGPWDPAVIDQAIPPLEEETRHGGDKDHSGEPPVVLGPEAMKVWRGEKPKFRDSGKLDTSATLVKIGRVLYDAGANRPVIEAALKERDRTLGYRKYTDRSEAEQQKRYREIVDELEDSGRKLRLVPSGEDSSDAAPTGNPNPTAGGSFNLTELGNAERFISLHGENVRYCYPWRKWLIYNGRRWLRDDSGEVHRLAKETVRSIYAEAAVCEDEQHRKALAKHATRSESDASIKAMLELAKSEVPVLPDELDADPFLLNVLNGTLDLRTGTLTEPRREDLITKMAGTEYHPDAKAPHWEAFLKRVQPNETVRSFLKRAAGYSATSDTSEQCMFIDYGTGANGKSTYQEALHTTLGDYALRTPTEMLLAKRTGGVPNDVARLKGARFVTASETGEGQRLDESLIKDLTGQDTITARFMRGEWFDFKPTHKLRLSTNHKPEIRGTDLAIWRRIRLTPWSVTIPPAEQNRKLPEKLRAECPGILRWIVEGAREWYREGLKAPDEVRQATKEYRAEMDVLAAFLDDCCVVADEEKAYSRELYAGYKRWCDESGERVESQKRFGVRLRERGFRNDRDSRTGRKMWFGLRLNTEWTIRAEGLLNPSGSSFAGKTSPAEPSEPKNDINGSENPSREVMRENGSEGSEGSVKDRGRI